METKINDVKEAEKVEKKYVEFSVVEEKEKEIIRVFGVVVKLKGEKIKDVVVEMMREYIKENKDVIKSLVM